MHDQGVVHRDLKVCRNAEEFVKNVYVVMKEIF